MSKITPWLWFAAEAEEAAAFYVGLFPDSHIDHVMRYPADGPGVTAGSVATVGFTLAGRPFAALNGGAAMERNWSVSLAYECVTQAEIDRVWEALISGGGRAEQCGWLKDRYGFSWQIVPAAMPRLMGDPDPARSARVMQAMMGMVKLDIAALEAARDG